MLMQFVAEQAEQQPYVSFSMIVGVRSLKQSSLECRDQAMQSIHYKIH